MNRTIGLILMLSLFLFLYFGMHFYVFTRLGGLFGIKRGFVFYSVVSLIALLFPVAMFLIRYGTGALTKIFYAISATWLGTLFLLLCATLLYEILNLFWKVKPIYAGIAIISVVLALTIIAVINAMTIHVNEIKILMPNLDKELRIVQVSDVHVGTIHNSDYLKEIVDMTNKLDPDMVLITGDLVDGSGPIDLSMLLPLKDIKAKSFFTTGNHEQYEGLDKVLPMVAATGVQILRNEIVNYRGMQIVGIDNPGDRFGGGNDVVGKLKINKTKPTILMYHPPLGLEDANKAGVNLQISGHTHNGQIIPFNLVSKIFYPRINGLYKYKGTYLYTSPGTGTWGPPMRLGSINEITLVRLVKK